MRHVFVGDVHGMSDELQSLVSKLKLAQGDTRVFGLELDRETSGIF